MLELDTRALGQKIRYTRRIRGLTAEALAGICEMAPISIRQIERGKRTPSLPTFVTLCDALNIEPNFLLGDQFVLDRNERLEHVTNFLASLDCDQLEKLIDFLESLQRS